MRNRKCIRTLVASIIEDLCRLVKERLRVLPMLGRTSKFWGLSVPNKPDFLL